MMRALLLTAALASLAPISARAANLVYDSETFYGVGIDITSPNNISGGAGQIQLWNSGSLVADAWCMDVGNYLAGAGTFGVLPFTVATVSGGVPGFPSSLTQAQLNTIANLVHDGDTAVAGGASQSLSAAYQVAIWTTEYSGTTLPFDYVGLGSTFATDVTSVLSAASLDGAPSGFSMSFLNPVSPEVSQTLIFESAVPTLTVGAPEPSTWAMGLIGFAGIAGLGLFNRRKSTRCIEA